MRQERHCHLQELRDQFLALGAVLCTFRVEHPLGVHCWAAFAPSSRASLVYYSCMTRKNPLLCRSIGGGRGIPRPPCVETGPVARGAASCVVAGGGLDGTKCRRLLFGHRYVSGGWKGEPRAASCVKRVPEAVLLSAPSRPRQFCGRSAACKFV